MKLDLSDIAAEVGKQFHYDVDEDCGDAEGLKCVEHVTGHLDFTNTGRLMVMMGNLTTKIELECVRCLKTYVLPVSVKVEEGFPIQNPQAVMAGHPEVFEPGEEDPLFVENVFDLTEFVRQAILVEVPMKPLCDAACLGLCPVCGKPLSECSCSCKIEEKGSPFDALRDLLE
jgi:uncharacterized protein